MQNQDQKNSESSTDLCIRCQKQPPSLGDMVCASCYVDVQREELRRQRDLKENEKRRLALVDDIGEKAVKEWTFDAFKPFDDHTKRSLDIARAFTPGIQNLYLTGITGCGKSHLAVAMAMKAFADGHMVHFFPSGPSLSRMFRGIEAAREKALIKELATTDVLIINELGIGRDTEFSIQIAVEVIDARVMRGKNGLIVTSNFHPADLAAKMKDSRLESRFTGLCKIIEVGIEDYRKLKRVA